MKMRHAITGLAIGAALSAGVLALAADNPDSKAASRLETFEKLELFADVLNQVESEYVTDVDNAEMIESAIEGMLRSLDPHSSFLSADRFRDMQVSTRGEYGGLGIEVVMEEGLIKIISPMDDTPADRAGLKSGDFVSAINDDPILGKSSDEAIDQMRGPIGTSVTLTILREGEAEPFDVTIVRELIRVQPVSWRIEDETVGYIRIATFNSQAADAVEEAVRELKRDLGDRMEGVIVDLRDNGGGLFEQAISISDVFLDGGEVVSTRGREPHEIERYNARPGDLLAGVDVVVLINQGSASSAEIVAGALQDRLRATVVGRTSFGKGSVQTVIPLRGGRAGALRLTTAKYYTPAGRSIQNTGIAPDVHVAYSKADAERGDRRRLSEADLPNALGNDTGAERAEEINIAYPPEDYPEGGDFQLERALDVLRGIDVTALEPRNG